MAIEIKELKIKVMINESDKNGFTENSSKISASKLQDVKAQIVEECTRKVLEKIKEKSER